MRGQGTHWRRIDRKDAANFFACYLADVIGGNSRARVTFLESLDNPQRHRHADIGANQRFLELIPIDRFASKYVDDVLKEFHCNSASSLGRRGDRGISSVVIHKRAFER